MSYNSLLSKALDQANHEAPLSKDKAALIDVFSLFTKFGTRIGFRYPSAKTVWLLTLLLWLIIGAGILWLVHQYSLTDPIALLFTVWLVSIGLLLKVLDRYSDWLSAKQNSIIYTSFIIHWHAYRLSNTQIETTKTLGKTNQLLRKFKHLKTVPVKSVSSWLKGDYQGKEINFHYEYITLITDNISLSIHTNWRFVLAFNLDNDFNFYLCPRLQKKHPDDWRSASIEFNDVYTVRSSSILAATKFFKPAILKELLSMQAKFQGLVFEGNANGEVYICVAKDLLQKNRPLFDLRNPQQFKREIERVKESELMLLMLAHVHNLMKYSDNNFEKITR